MRRAAALAYASGRRQISVASLHRQPEVCPLAIGWSLRSLINPPAFSQCSRIVHFTASRSQQPREAGQHTAASPSTAVAPSAHNTDCGTGSSSAPSSPTSSRDGSPITVTAVATPLSRSAAAAAAAQSSSAVPSPLRLLRVPDLELGDAKLSKWLVRPDSAFTADCVLCELDTDMAVIEYKADRPGWLAVHAVEEGDEVRVDQPIAVACDSAEQVERVKKEWLAKVERKERRRELRAEHPAHTLSEEVAKMKE